MIHPNCNEALSCHSEPFAVILSAARDLALGAQDKLREEFCLGFWKNEAEQDSSLRSE